MTLEATRNKCFELIRLAADMRDENDVTEWLGRWFMHFKNWERAETFDRAMTESRMTIRMAPMRPDRKPWVSRTGEKGDVFINASVGGISEMQTPKNFIDKRKNELGLHDVSAVLLRPNLALSPQLFTKPDRIPVFMPIPQHEDLQLFHEIAGVAKANRAGPIYQFYVEARARMTRIKYGSDTDINTGFLKIDKGDGRDHYRYGDATTGAGPVQAEVLRQRMLNAREYPTRIVASTRVVENNEVTLKYRAHASTFPYMGVKGEMSRQFVKTPPPNGTYLLIDMKGQLKGQVDDAGHFTPS